MAPIGEYEVVEVWLIHDMVGYVGVEYVVYRAWMKIMEQVEGGDVVVRKGNEARQDDDEKRDLNVCEGFVEAMKLAKVCKERRNSLCAKYLTNIINIPGWFAMTGKHRTIDKEKI
jgi:hypothetical protein